jgi:hypothetical protein
MRGACVALTAVLVSGVVVTPVAGQARSRQRPEPPPAAAADAPNAPASPGADSARRSDNRNVTVIEINLARAAVDSISDALAQRSQGKSLSERLQSSLRTTAVGDKQKVEQLKTLVARQAQAAVPDQRVTVIAVLGSTQDLERAISSLSAVQRRVAVVHLDVNKSDDRIDNTGMKAGVADAAKRSLDNVWVFLARNRRSPRDRPDHVLPGRTLSATMWNGLFAADGDAVNVAQLRGAGGRGRSAAAEGSLPAGAVASDAAMSSSGLSAAHAFSAGDVVIPKISGMKVYREASASSAVVGTATREDEFVVESAALVSGMVRVVGNLSGWVNAALVKKR